MATNQRHPQRSYFDPVLVLACIGALASSCFAVLALYPLGLASYRYWFGT